MSQGNRQLIEKTYRSVGTPGLEELDDGEFLAAYTAAVKLHEQAAWAAVIDAKFENVESTDFSTSRFMSLEYEFAREMAEMTVPAYVVPSEHERIQDMVATTVLNGALEDINDLSVP